MGFSIYINTLALVSGYVPSVLVPRLDLGVCEVEFGRQLLPVLHAQVFLLLEAPP